MSSLALAALALSLALDQTDRRQSLTFDEAVTLAVQTSRSSNATPETVSVMQSYLPNVRIEVTGNASRTLDVFSEGPFEVRYASSVLAFDYPLWDGGATRARVDSVRARLARAQGRGVSDARFAQLLDVFGALYVAQREEEIIAPLSQELSTEAERSARLLAAGEITNLVAAERSEIAFAFQSRLLDVQSRRIDAAARLRLLTGLEEEPRLSLDLSQAAPPPGDVADDSVQALTVAVDASRARLREVTLSNGFRATLSGFAGLGTASSDFRGVGSEGSSGVYGLRVGLSYPLLGGTSGLMLAEARADLEATIAQREAALLAARERASEYRVREEAARQRVELLRKSIETAAKREESLLRLVRGGLRTESDLAQARAERIRREVDVLGLEVERWKAARLLSWMSGQDGSVQP